MRANHSEDNALRLNHPHLPRTLPACNLIHRSKRLYNGNGKNEAYPVELSVQRLSPGLAIVEYTRETLFQRKGCNVDITINRCSP